MMSHCWIKWLKRYYKSYVYNSSFNKIISNLFSNLNSLNIIELHKLSEIYFKIGYSNKDIKLHLTEFIVCLFFIF